MFIEMISNDDGRWISAMPRRFFALLLVLEVVLGQSAFGRDWAVYNSDYFTIYSDLREKEVLNTLEQLETFGQVAAEFLAIPGLSDRDRATFFMFDRSVEFNLIQEGESAQSPLYRHIVGPSILVDGVAQDLMRRRYVRYLMTQYSDLLYPTWYLEGVAEVLKTADIGDSSIILGIPTDSFEANARLAAAVGSYFHPIPVARMIDLNLGDNTSNFYPTAWLMAHYLLIDSFDDTSKRQQTGDYLRRFDSGDDPIAAISESYGVSPGELDSELELYGRKQSFRTLERAPIEYRGELTHRVLDEGEILYILGNFLVGRNQYSSAHRYFDSFRDLQIDSRFSSRVMSARAIAYLHEKRLDDSDALIDQLVEDGSTDIEVLTNLAHYFFDRHLLALDGSDDASAILLSRAIEYAERAAQQEPKNLAALYYLGRAHELAGDLSSATQSLTDAENISPAEWPVNLALARISAKRRQTDSSSFYVSRLYSSARTRNTRDRLREIQDRLEDVDFVVNALNDL